MKIIPVGVYGPYPGIGGATNCYLVDNGKAKIVIDMGSGSLATLKKYTKLSDVDAFILSHLHFDHFCDALPLAYTAGIKKVFCPATPKEFFSLFKNHTPFQLGVINPNSVIEIGGMKLEFFPVVHPVETYAIKVSEEGHSFVYTSDTVWFEGLVGFVKGADLVLADCTSARGTPHMTPEEGAYLSARAGVKVVGVHMNPDYDASFACQANGIEQAREGKAIVVW